MTRHPQQKDVTFLKAEVDDADRKAKTLVVKISTDIMDRDKEVILPAGIRKTNFDLNPVVLWAHMYAVPPIAKALWTKRDGTRWLSKPQFANYDFAQLVFDLYADEFMRAWSIGFIPTEGKSRRPTEADLKSRPDWAGVSCIHEECELLEYSAVPVPCNPDALALAVQAAVTKGVKVPQDLLSCVQLPTPPAGGAAESPAVVKAVRIAGPDAPAAMKLSRLAQPDTTYRPQIRRIGTSAALDAEIAARMRGMVSLRNLPD